ncbi:MAG TPA: DUF4168 domain-containing protein [Gillisia sp.]|nr:DUF4168 domain-containing protein [Gillisia sp.]
MLKMKLNLKAIMICAGLFAGTTAFAQTPQLPQQQETPQINVSDAELEKFAQVIQALQTAEQESQKKMIAIVEEQDLDIEKFNEIHQAKMQNLEVTASVGDQQKHQKAVAKLEAMQPEIMKMMESIITTEGLTMERFQQIATAMQSSPELQQKLQQLMMG